MTDAKKSARISLAKKKILEAYNHEDGEFSSTLFVQHHLEEIDREYWSKHFGSEKPSPKSILQGLVLVDCWDSEDDDNIDTYDFSLPEGATHYMLSVRFDEHDSITDFNMES